jgi:four helix bundle protein
MSNIAEGFDSGSNREFLKFLAYALRSASELQSHLYVALDQGYVSGEVFDKLYGQARTVKNLIGGFRRYLRSQSRPGQPG